MRSCWSSQGTSAFRLLLTRKGKKHWRSQGSTPQLKKKRNSGQNCLRADRPADTHTHVSGITDGWTDGFVERLCCMEERSCLLGSRSKYLLNSIQQPAWASWMNHQGHEAASAKEIDSFIYISRTVYWNREDLSHLYLCEKGKQKWRAQKREYISSTPASLFHLLKHLSTYYIRLYYIITFLYVQISLNKRRHFTSTPDTGLVINSSAYI